MDSAAITTGGARDRILQVAKALFAREGFHGTSMQAVAAAAGISKSTVFHHFQSKNSLYLSVLKATCDEKAKLLEAFEQGGGGIEGRLDEFVRQHLAIILADEAGTRLILQEVLESGPERGRVLAEDLFGPDFRRLVAILQQGQASGAWRTDVDAAFLAFLLIAANLFFFQNREVLHYLPAVDFAHEPDRYAAMTADVLLRGIRRGPAGRESEGGGTS